MKKMENVCLDGMWERLENELQKQNISKMELARRCGFDRKNLIKHNKHSSIYLPYVARICAELHISADYLLFGK